jgi:6-phosphofructokinase
MGFFFGYQARSALPSNFDCALGAALGATAAHLVAGGGTQRAGPAPSNRSTG